MKKVGIKALKNDLSKYIHLVREGEVVYVTDRDAVVAEIRKPTRKKKPKSRWEEFLDREEKAGRLVRASMPEAPLSEILKDMADMPPTPPGIDWKRVMDETREDRF
jgi:antitoxin (DNA-binding transcriptional repressor) of toxin-antitoxin stability system